jgi:hypothetical protein
MAQFKFRAFFSVPRASPINTGQRTIQCANRQCALQERKKNLNLVAAFRLLTDTNLLLVLLYSAETETHCIKDDIEIKRNKDIDRHRPKQIPTYAIFPTLPDSHYRLDYLQWNLESIQRVGNSIKIWYSEKHI